jgi:hypothetical protein
VRHVYGHISNEYVIPGGLPPVIDALVRDELAPAVQRRDEPHGYYTVNQPAQEARLDPFLRSAGGQVLAGRYDRHIGQSETWVLPDDTPHKDKWILAALQLWHERWPNRFPAANDWRQDPTWMTAEEATIAGDVQRLRVDRLRLLADLDARESELRERLSAVGSVVDTSERRLLTAKGASLVDAVASTLSELGFNVENADETADPGQRLEDLRVTDAAESGWIALVEVRGYGGGAAVNDLLRVGRHAKEYAVRTGQAPTREWYIVNQFIGRDPSSRPDPFASDLASVREWGGLAIDTSHLFRLSMAVRTRDADADAVRKELREASGIWRFEDARTVLTLEQDE